MKICRILFWLFAMLYAGALAIFFIGTLGLFEQEPDPLSGVFLVPLGLPWNRFVDVLPEAVWPWAAALSPAVNLIILFLICRAMSRR